MGTDVRLATAAKKAMTVSLPESLLTAAEELGINVSEAAEAGLAKAVSEERTARWQKENAEAIACYNDYVEEHGLPLAMLMGLSDQKPKR